MYLAVKGGLGKLRTKVDLMKARFFTEEEIEKLNQDHAKKNQEYNELYEKSIEEIWLSECDEFIRNYKKL